MVNAMKIVVATCCYRDRGTDEIEETIVKCGENGFPYVELAGPLTYMPSMIQWVDLARMKQFAKDNRVELVVNYGPHIDNTSRDKAIESAFHLKRTIHATKALNIKKLVITAAPRVENGLSHTIEGLKEVIGDLRETGIELCLENHYKSQFQFHSDYVELMDAFADAPIGITFDSGHFHSSGVDVNAFLQTFAAQIKHVHLKDHIGTQAVSLSRGEIPLPQIIQQLKRNGYQDYISIELESNIHNSLEQTKDSAGNALFNPDHAHHNVVESYAYLQSLIAKA